MVLKIFDVYSHFDFVSKWLWAIRYLICVDFFYAAMGIFCCCCCFFVRVRAMRAYHHMFPITAGQCRQTHSVFNGVWVRCLNAKFGFGWFVSVFRLCGRLAFRLPSLSIVLGPMLHCIATVHHNSASLLCKTIVNKGFKLVHSIAQCN